MEISFSHVLENLTPNPSPEREGSNNHYRLRETLCLRAFVAKKINNKKVKIRNKEVAINFLKLTF